jgi:alkylated DNA repair dioxygenase AlkB
MDAALQSSLQGSLLDLDDEPACGPLGRSVRRTTLAHGAWVDIRPGWMSGATVLFDRLRDTVPWREERRRMYERVVDVPRLLCFYAEGEPLPDPALLAARDALTEHYWPDLREPLCTAGLCLYRDGRDSVAWHGDRIGRGSTEDTVIAILSLGTPRALLLRPRGGGPALRHELGHGDLLVMGGSCQRTWEHAVPKTTRATGPRISVQFRPRGVR